MIAKGSTVLNVRFFVRVRKLLVLRVIHHATRDGERATQRRNRHLSAAVKLARRGASDAM